MKEFLANDLPWINKSMCAEEIYKQIFQKGYEAAIKHYCITCKFGHKPLSFKNCRLCHSYLHEQSGWKLDKNKEARYAS